MTLDEIMRDIQALREDLLVFERKYGAPTEVFYEAYQHGEEPDDPAWVLDWSEWAATQQLLQDRLAATSYEFLSRRHRFSSQAYLA